MATMTKTPQLNLPDYISKISEHADVRAGSPMPLGAHTLEECGKVTEETLQNVFIQLNCQRVLLEGMILKPNMVLPGLTCPTQESVDEVANITVKSLWRTVPAAFRGLRSFRADNPLNSLRPV
jgi:hypothetical protein